MRGRGIWPRLGARIVVALTLLGALPATVLATNLCLSLSDGSTLVLVNFKVKKGGTSAVAGWRSAPGGFGITFLSSLSGQTIATLDGQRVAMDITEGGAGLTRGPDGKLNGESNTYFRTLHAITLNAGTDGKIGDGATGLDERFYVAGSVPNLDLGTSAITAALCPKDLGTLGLPSGY